MILFSSLKGQESLSKIDSILVRDKVAPINQYGEASAVDRVKILENVENAINSLKTDEQKIYAFQQTAYKLAKVGVRPKANEYLQEAIKITQPQSLERAQAVLIRTSYLLGEWPLKSIVDQINEVITYEEIKGTELEAKLFMYRGRAFYEFGKYDEAAPDYFNAKEYYDKNQIRNSNYGDLLHFIGSLFKRQNNGMQALEFYNELIELGVELEDKRLEADGLYLAADMHNFLGNPEKDLEMNLKALDIYNEIGDLGGKALQTMNVAHIYLGRKDYPNARIYLDKAAILNTESHYDQNLPNIWRYYAKYYSKTGKYDSSMIFLDRSFEAAEKANSKRLLYLTDAYRTQAWIQYDYKHYKEAFESLDDSQIYYDSLVNERNTQIIHELEAQYESEKQITEIEILNKENEFNTAALKTEKQKNIILIIGLSIVAMLLLLLFNRFKTIGRQKYIIEEQKKTVEVAFKELDMKNREVLDSITYAKRIQTAILPADKLVKEFLKDSFILFKPKDIVAGDFYWMEQLGNTILFAAADCTGHGVPGAMVSVICNNGLNRSVREYALTDPGKILDKTREIVVQEFEKSEDDVMDGMDIALCSLTDHHLSYSGANNPLWIIKNDAITINEVKADKQPVGIFQNPQDFTTHHIELAKGDTIYIFSDGYRDQFGGSNDKKFKTVNFKKLLLSIQNEPMEKQRIIINETFEKWKGDREQIDDICIIGVRV
ncbi:MAG: SpoIIE family protein phosphatase [Bacteroidia bacterium]